jgi:hypothetical protein
VEHIILRPVPRQDLAQHQAIEHISECINRKELRGDDKDLVPAIAAPAIRTIGGVAARSEKAAAGSVNFMQPSDKFVQFAAKRADIDPAGALDIVAHGSKNSIKIARGTGTDISADHRLLTELLRRNPEFKDQPIRLLSCHTGDGADCFAQNLSNKLGVDVTAPDKYLWANPDGTMFVAGGKQVGKDLVPDMTDLGSMKTFSPRTTK